MREFPVFQEIAEMYKDADFALITLDRDKDKAAAVKWIGENDYDFTEWAYDTGNIFAEYKGYNNDSGGIPQTVIIDRDGNVRFAQLGAIDKAEKFTVVIDDLL